MNSIREEDGVAVEEREAKDNEQQKQRQEQEQIMMENSQIFEELVEEIDDDDEIEAVSINNKRMQQHRRPSLEFKSGLTAPITAETTMSNNSNNNNINIKRRNVQRRHSGFESAHRFQHKENHEAMKSYLESTEDQQTTEARTKLVGTLLQFNLSVSLSMASMSDVDALSGGMQYSCPILSYMEDDEEDSVELVVKHRPAMTSTNDDNHSQPWEKLKGCDISDVQQQEQEGGEESKFDYSYTMKLPPIDEDKKKRAKKRKHSYKILQERLEDETPQEILRSMSHCGSVYDLDRAPAPAKMPRQMAAKSLDSEANTHMRHMAFQNTGSEEVGFTDRRDLSPPRHLQMGVARGA